MGSKFLRLAGRILIITFLLSSSLMKIGNPSSYESTFKNTYTKTKTMFPIFNFLPPLEKVTPFMNKIIAGIGLMEGIGALLILFGDKLGGYIFLGVVIMGQISTNGMALMQVVKLVNVARVFQMGPFLCLLGIALLLCDTNYIRRKAINY